MKIFNLPPSINTGAQAVVEFAGSLPIDHLIERVHAIEFKGAAVLRAVAATREISLGGIGAGIGEATDVRDLITPDQFKNPPTRQR